MTLRIIAGKHRGRKIFMKEGKDIRPTGSRAREGIFNILLHGRFAGLDNSPIVDKKVVDLFCGSGALGLEALSRGAAHVTFVDQSGESIALVKHNVEHFGEMGNAKFVRSDSANLPPSTHKFTLAFMDPPYKSALAIKALESLHKNKWLEPDAVVVVEVSKTEEILPPSMYDVFDMRDYGNNRIYFLNYSPDK
jgi:16S rRNA (guanine966-N2)-methyltransferase